MIMRKSKPISILLSVLSLLLFTHCSSDDNVEEQQKQPTTETKDSWIIYNSTAGWGGNIYSFSALPQGELSLADKNLSTRLRILQEERLSERIFTGLAVQHLQKKVFLNLPQIMQETLLQKASLLPKIMALSLIILS